MTGEHWLFLLSVAFFVTVLLVFTLNHRPQSSAYRWCRRIFWSLIFLRGCSLLGGPGLNAATLLLTAVLGIPGGCALLVLAAI